MSATCASHRLPSDGRGEGDRAGDRRRMSVRHGGGQRRLVGRPGRIPGPEQPEHGGPGRRARPRGVGGAGPPPGAAGPKSLPGVVSGPARPAHVGGRHPGREPYRMIVYAGQHCIRHDERKPGVGSRGRSSPREDRGERFAGQRADQRAPAPVAGGRSKGGITGRRQTEELGEMPGGVFAESSVEVVVGIHRRSWFLSVGGAARLRHQRRGSARGSRRRHLVIVNVTNTKLGQGLFRVKPHGSSRSSRPRHGSGSP